MFSVKMEMLKDNIHSHIIIQCGIVKLNQPYFDLCRLTKTIIDYVEPEGDVYRLLELWSRDKYGNSLLEHEDDFDLYRIIAKNVKSAVPVKQLEKKVFQRFIIQESDVPEGEILYKY